jgi:hypothetical protein
VDKRHVRGIARADQKLGYLAIGRLVID